MVYNPSGSDQFAPDALMTARSVLDCTESSQQLLGPKGLDLSELGELHIPSRPLSSPTERSVAGRNLWGSG